MEVDINAYIRDLVNVTAEKERIGAELNIATQIQADMLPRIFPAFPGRHEFDLFATMDPAKEVGGDFYDFFLVDKDHIALVMADVSGKGVPAALFMVIAKTLIKNRAQLGESPAEVLTNVNEQLCEGNEAELFVTVWLAVIEIATGKGMAANAGHEHPALCRAGGKFELVEYRHSPAVATMEGVRFREHPFELYPGDKLVVYTDGVTEATDAHEELFGNDRLLDALNRDPSAPPKQLLSTLRKEIDTFVGDAPQFDDITMLGFHYIGMAENENTLTEEAGR
jgi:sigma-B regulation protein RsbU (phosphoserine phosphatase)